MFPLWISVHGIDVWNPGGQEGLIIVSHMGFKTCAGKGKSMIFNTLAKPVPLRQVWQVLGRVSIINQCCLAIASIFYNTKMTIPHTPPSMPQPTPGLDNLPCDIKDSQDTLLRYAITADYSRAMLTAPVQWLSITQSHHHQVSFAYKIYTQVGPSWTNTVQLVQMPSLSI